MNDVSAPRGFLRFSEAISRLEEGMWGGLPQPDPVRNIKRTFKKASIGTPHSCGQKRRTGSLRSAQASSSHPVCIGMDPRKLFSCRGLAEVSGESQSWIASFCQDLRDRRRRPVTYDH